MKLIAVTRPEYFVVEHLLIRALFDEGLDILHLRKPEGKLAKCERLLSLLPDECREKIVVHDHFELKKKYGLMGVHLSNRNPELPSGFRGSVSCTCHSVEELAEYKPKMKYAFLGAMYGSLSEETELRPPFTFTQLRAASDRGLIDSKVVAFGGITTGNVGKFREYGFGGVAVSGALASRFNPVESADIKDEINYFRLLRRATE